MLRLILIRSAQCAACVSWLTCLAAPATAEPPVPLVLEQKIPLGKVSGRIDHLALDLERHRLFVAELGNNSVGVVDLDAGRLVRNLSGFKRPQGVAYVKSTDTLYVSNAGDGSVQLFQGPDLVAAGRIDLGDDADNIRVDQNGNKVFVGYGGGALAIIDPSRRAKVADIALPAHPDLPAYWFRRAAFRQFARRSANRGCGHLRRQSKGRVGDQRCPRQFPHGDGREPAARACHVPKSGEARGIRRERWIALSQGRCLR
jgi:hypothetical protein